MSCKIRLNKLSIEGITSEIILDKVTIPNKRILSDKEILKEIENTKTDVLLTLGAGDIDKLVEPIEHILKDKARVKI